MKYSTIAGKSASDLVIKLILVIIGIITAYPIIYVFSMSVSSKEAVLGGSVFLWPVGFTLDSYKQVFFENQSIWLAYINTIWYVVVGTAINIVLTVTSAYVLTRTRFFARKFFTSAYIFTMLFSGGLIPLFILIRNLGIYNTRWANVLPVACSVYNIIITRVFLQNNIPESLIESAKIDGYNDIGILFRIVIPLSKQIIAIISLFCAVSFWNSYFRAMIFLPDSKLKPLQILLMEILIQNSNVMNGNISDAIDRMFYFMQIKHAVIIISIAPIMCAYPFVQKYFVKGVLIGSLKG